MKWIVLILTGFMAASLISCTPTTEKTAEKKDAEKTAAPPPADPAVIDKVRNEFIAAFNAADVAKIVAQYTDDAVIMPTQQPALTGHAGIEEYNKKLFGAYSAKITITPVETKVFGDRALDRGTYTMELTPKAGGAPMKDEGKYLVLLQRQADGSWKVTHDIDNSSLPAAPGPAAPAPKTEPGKKK
jgi:uncharacterized protein (TIGR02246 family)